MKIHTLPAALLLTFLGSTLVLAQELPGTQDGSYHQNTVVQTTDGKQVTLGSVEPGTEVVIDGRRAIVEAPQGTNGELRFLNGRVVVAGHVEQVEVRGQLEPVPTIPTPVSGRLALPRTVPSEPELDDPLFQELRRGDADALFQKYGKQFSTRAEFEQVLDETRRLDAQGLPAPDALAGIEGTYSMREKRKKLWPFGGRPSSILTVSAGAEPGQYAVTHTRIETNAVEKTTVSGTGEWNAERRTLKVTFPVVQGLAQHLSLFTSEEVEGQALKGEFRIEPTTGRIEGKFDGKRAAGWRDASITPLTGYYELRDDQRNTYQLYINDVQGRIVVRRHRTDRSGRVTVRLGVATVDGRKVEVKFPGPNPRLWIEYRIREDGRISGSYFVFDRAGRPHGMHEQGWRDGVEQPQLPGLFQRGWAGIKRLFER